MRLSTSTEEKEAITTLEGQKTGASCLTVKAAGGEQGRGRGRGERSSHRGLQKRKRGKSGTALGRNQVNGWCVPGGQKR